ncbi:STAS domain-containing protein [Alteromonas sp. KUL49]|uniref:STAS domain-containing protein n=1 Tax=Alteromonas sp. KUL49 TaxID=2480798 RepID=UPI00102EFCAB|nr:STAS domain-containing protein [Alteromonas sp. KUL49]TAP40776.1 anti-sigma factor antagonist [Alteromonas sp. KUL49]GEA10949.1 anti-anti-sigma regulatory factor [Alteromonas sp. KUL49]
MTNTLNTQVKNDTISVQLPEEFDGFSVDKAREQLDSIALDMHHHVVLDFADTQFIDSSGVGAIVFLFKRITKQGRTLQLVHVEGQPHKLLSMLHVDRTISVNAATPMSA